MIFPTLLYSFAIERYRLWISKSIFYFINLFFLIIILSPLFISLPAKALTPGPLTSSDDERHLLSTLAKKKLIRARKESEDILKKNPKSIVGRYVLARVFHEEETNLPRALYHMKRAEKDLLELHPVPIQSEKAQLWHREILLNLQYLLGEMDRRKEQLKLLDRYDSLYRPPLKHLRIWPLMKLHRFAEARKIATKATLSSNLTTRITGYNGLLSIEFEREATKRCYEVAMRAVNATAERSCILDLNTAEAAFSVFRFSEVERLSLKSLQAPIKDCPSSAHNHLANLFLLRGDFQRAISAVKDARKQSIPRHHRQQFEAGITAWLARMLYALGEFDKSYQLSKRVLRSPDRMGLQSYSNELIETISTVDHYALLIALAEEQAEKISVRPYIKVLPFWTKKKEYQVSSFLFKRKIARLLRHEKSLVSMMRPYLKPIPSWQLFHLAEIVGKGVTLQALAKIRKQDEMKKEVEPYLKAIEASLIRTSNPKRSLTLIENALKKLPPDEKLLQGHLYAFAANNALRLNLKKRALKYFKKVLYQWPTALRINKIRLPATIITTKSNLAKKIGNELQNSRRINTDKNTQLGFSIRIENDERTIRICLNGPKRRYTCSHTEIKNEDKEDHEELTIRAIDEFHKKAFAPLIDLTQQDINSLDGSAVRGKADQVLKEIFKL